MDDFGSQVGSQLDAGLDNSSNVTIYTRNIVFRVDLLKNCKKGKMKKIVYFGDKNYR